MENGLGILAKYNNLEKESEALLVDFLKKCPNNSWEVNVQVGIQTGHFATCERIFLSSSQGLCFCFKDYTDYNGRNIIHANQLMYGEMAQIIGILPNEVELERYRKLQDFIIPNYSIEGLLSDYPFYDNVAFGKVQITDIKKVEGNNVYLKGLQNDGGKIRLHYLLEDEVVGDFIAHLEKSIMLCSKQYKIIKSYLDLQENLNLDIDEEVTMECKDITFKVESVDTTDGEGFSIHGVTTDNYNCYIVTDVFTLHPQDLDGLVGYIREDLESQYRYYVIDNLQKAFGNSTASTIYDAIIDDVIDEMMTHWNFQKALDNVVLKRMGLWVWHGNNCVDN